MGKEYSSDNITYLMDGASLNDSLLQSYRNFHLTMQSIFLAIGTMLFISIITFKDFLRLTLLFILLLAVFTLSLTILYKMKRIIISRGEDVNFWHRALLKAEQNVPENERYFTMFKIYQQSRYKKSEERFLKETFLSENVQIDDEDMDILIDRNLGYTRKILDSWLFTGITIIWALLFLFSVSWYLFYLHTFGF